MGAESIYITVDLGGTTVKLGLFKNYELIDFTTYGSTTTKEFHRVLEDIKEQVELLLEKNHLHYEKLVGIGLAMPGIINSKTKQVLSINDKYISAVGFDIDNWFKEHMQLEVLIDNDANAALLGEYAKGTLEGAEFATLFMLGTGVGTAAMMNGQLIRGAHHQAGYLAGHISINYDGRICNCGARGCVESEASTWALKPILEGMPSFKDSSLFSLERIEIRELIEHAKGNDTVANQVLNNFINKWATGIVNLIHAYDPEVVLLSGGVMKAGDFLIQPIMEYVYKHAWTPYGKVKFAISDAPELSALYGMHHQLREKDKK